MSNTHALPFFRARASGFAKQAFLALLTGGLSLLWLIAKHLPGAWERTWLLRAEWIRRGRNPHEWEWLGHGWLAVLGTIVVALPASLVLGSLGSMVFRLNPLLPGQHPPLPALLLALIFLCTFLSVSGLFCVYCAHTLRMAASLAWARILSLIRSDS